MYAKIVYEYNDIVKKNTLPSKCDKEVAGGVT